MVDSFAAVTARSLPGMLECPGTHCIKMDDEVDDIHLRMDVVRGWHDDSASNSDWLFLETKMEVWTKLAFVEVHCKAASIAAISSS